MSVYYYGKCLVCEGARIFRRDEFNGADRRLMDECECMIPSKWGSYVYIREGVMLVFNERPEQ